MNDDPLGYFITWTVYGTFLQGDSRWWSHRRNGKTSPLPKLEVWHRGRLKHDVLVLNQDHRNIVETEIARLSTFRDWHLWAANVRTNHVHIVVSAKHHTGRQVRDQLKANCTRALRRRHLVFRNRPVWSVGGDWKCVNDEDGLTEVIEYSTKGQDLRAREVYRNGPPAVGTIESAANRG